MFYHSQLGVIKMRQEQNTPHSSQDDNKNIAAQKRKDSNPTSSLPSSKFCYWGKSFRKKNNKTEKNSSSNINKNSESTESTSGRVLKTYLKSVMIINKFLSMFISCTDVGRGRFDGKARSLCSILKTAARRSLKPEVSLLDL